MFDSHSRICKCWDPIRITVLPGIGDIIYTWFRLQPLVRVGLKFHVQVMRDDRNSFRAKALRHILPGIDRIERCDIHWREAPADNPKALTDDLVLNPNAWLAKGRHLREFLPFIRSHDYHPPLVLPQQAIDFAWSVRARACGRLLIALYTSNYRNNEICCVSTDPSWWCQWIKQLQPLVESSGFHVAVVGAKWDTDLGTDVAEQLNREGVSVSQHFNCPLSHVLALIAQADLLVGYESGLVIAGGVFATPTIAVFQNQSRCGSPRNDVLFPYLGVVDPDLLWRRFVPAYWFQSPATVLRACHRFGLLYEWFNANALRS